MSESGNETIRRGKLEFLRKNIIGTTPSSIVFKGTFKETIEVVVATEVAIKRIPLNSAKLAENEIQVLLKRTDHDNVVKYYCTEQDDDFCYIAMQLCSCNLEEYVEKKGNYNPSLPNTPVEEILRGAAEGLSHIHKKDIVHRDIKPSNILLFVKENKLVAKISDFGISRFIPNHQTVSGNFSAGTDLYKAPELLTPAFSWRSDVYAFGLVVFYVLSEGKHLFNENLSHIIKGNPVNLKKLSGQPTALSLVKWLTAFDQEERPRMPEVVNHPFFWDDEKKLNYIRDVHQITEDPHKAFLKEVIEEDSHHVICCSPENCGNQRTPPDPGACADWTRSLTSGVKTDCVETKRTSKNIKTKTTLKNVKTKTTLKNVKTKSCAELVRIIRNKLTHFNGLEEAVKAEYGGSIKDFRRYWLDRFPSLIVHLWEKVEITHLAAFLRGYYAPESVRRTNVEKTLLKTIDECELRDAQELQNKVKRLGSKIWEDALRSAVVKGRKEHVEVLLKDKTVTDIKDLLATLLLIAAKEGFVQVAQLLIDHGAEVNCKNYHGETPLHEAAKYGHLAVAQILIEHGAEVNCEDNYMKETPLHIAARKGLTEVATLLIEHGAEIYCKNNNFEETPLHRASGEGHLAVAELLIKRGAEVNCKNYCGHTPLHYAAERGHLAVAQILIKRGAAVNCKNNNFEETPIHTTLRKRHSEVAKLLIEHDAEVNCENYLGETPLHKAAEMGDLAVAQLLIVRGAEVNCKNKDGNNPLHAAALGGHSEVAKLLIEHDAEVNCKNKYGWTPLDHASKNSHTEMIELLSNLSAEYLPTECVSPPKRRRLE